MTNSWLLLSSSDAKLVAATGFLEKAARTKSWLFLSSLGAKCKAQGSLAACCNDHLFTVLKIFGRKLHGQQLLGRHNDSRIVALELFGVRLQPHSILKSCCHDNFMVALASRLEDDFTACLFPTVALSQDHYRLESLGSRLHEASEAPST